MNLSDFPSMYSVPAIIIYILALTAMLFGGLTLISGRRKRISISLLAAFVVLISFDVWLFTGKESSITAFEESIASHFEEGYGYKLTSDNAEQIRLAKGLDTVLHVMTEEGNVHEVLFRAVDGVVVPFSNDTNGEWARATASGS